MRTKLKNNTGCYTISETENQKKKNRKVIYNEKKQKNYPILGR